MGSDVRELEASLSEPTAVARRVLSEIDGDIVVLGAGGKMGPTLAMMLRRAAPHKTIYAVSRFSDADVVVRLEAQGVETIAADLLDESSYASLPDVPNVFYLAGMKFGATGKEPLTWAMNAYLPALVARHYRDARIVALSTGNVYPFTGIDSSGAREEDIPRPVGEYAQSCLGRERIFEHFSLVHGTRVALIRLNYANEPRYGIIVDLTRKILNDQPIDVTMGAINLIWQGDANNYIIAALQLSASPAAILNVTGPETIFVCDLATRIGRSLGRENDVHGPGGGDGLALECVALYRDLRFARGWSGCDDRADRSLGRGRQGRAGQADQIRCSRRKILGPLLCSIPPNAQGCSRAA